MKITRGYKTELDPTVRQSLLLGQCTGTARFAYYYGLARKQEVYKASKQFISALDLQKELTARKHSDLPWLRGMSKWIVQNALRDLETAYTNFFRRGRALSLTLFFGSKSAFRIAARSASHSPVS